MSLVGLVQLTERLLNQTLDNPQESQAQTAAKLATAQNAAANGAGAANTDIFVPSAQSAAPDAGTFQVGQVSLFSAAADILLARSAAPAPAAATAANNSTGAADANPALTKAPASNTAATTVPAISNVASTATTQNAQTQLADFNASLAALGLSQAEITVVDRIAQLIQDFNPAAFRDIIEQLQALAQAAAPQTTAANSGAAGPKATAAAA